MTNTTDTRPTATTVRTLGSRTRATCDDRGVVRVWDSVAGHYTVCHSLSATQERYVRARVRPS